MNELSQNLPSKWVLTTMNDISKKLKAGGTPSKKINEYYDGDIPFVVIEDMVNSNKYLYHTKIKITSEGLNNSSAWIVPENSILYSMYASYGIPIINKIKVATNQAIINFILNSSIDINYVYYYLLFIKPFLGKYTRGTTQKNLNATIIRNFSFPLAPYNEQKHIVSKIEELFTKLDSGIKELTLAKEKLKIYRQSVLKHAFDGNLTHEWREVHKDEIEQSSILDKINKDSKNKLGTKYKEFAFLDVSNLPKLPNEWIWAKLGLVADKVTDGTHHSPKIQFDEPGKDRFLYITSKNIKTKGVDLRNITYVDKEVHQEIYNRCNPELGDVLLIKDGAITGRSTINNLEEEFSLLSSVALIKLNSKYLLPKYVNYYITSPMGQKSILGSISGVAITRTNLKKINNTPIPFIGIKEQEIIVDEVEKILSKVEKNEEVIDQTLLQSQKLRQSILKKAFQGQLVPQNPNDEPAEKLLERIKAEKGKKPKRKTKQKIKSKQKVLV